MEYSPLKPTEFRAIKFVKTKRMRSKYGSNFQSTPCLWNVIEIQQPMTTKITNAVAIKKKNIFQFEKSASESGLDMRSILEKKMKFRESVYARALGKMRVDN